jgi:hypothetical protein
MVGPLGKKMERSGGVNYLARKGYRGVEFNIKRLDDWNWTWAIYPNNGDGAPLAGRIQGSELTAAALAHAAIDGWLAGKSV